MNRNLAEENVRLHAILDGMNVGTWEWNIQTDDVVYNDRWAEMIGYTLAELEPVSVRTWQDRLHPEDANAADELLARHFSGEVPYYDCECRAKHKNGGWVWIRVRGRVMTWTPNGKPLLMFGTHSDISPRKRAEQDLRISEEKFAKAFGSSPLGMTITDLETGKILEANASFTACLGFTEEEAIGRTTLELGIWMRRADRDHVLAGFVEKGFLRNVEVYLRSKEGADVTLLLSAELMRLRDRRCMLAVFQDVTQQKKSEEIARAHRVQHRTIIQTAMDGYWRLDMCGRFLEVNAAYCELIGYAEQELLEMRISDIEVMEKPEETAAHVQRVLNTGRERFETKHRRKDGQEADVEVSTQYFPGNGGELVCFIHDITRRKQAERAMIAAERLSATSELAAAVAHDFNNSLQMIFSNLEMALLNPDLPTNVGEYLQAALASAQRSAASIRQLQRSTKKRMVEFKSMNLNTILDEVILSTRPLWKDLAEKRGIHVTIQRSFGNIARVDGDPGEIANVFHNLIKNACEALDQSGMIFFETGTERGHVYVRVTDTGSGMDEDTRMRIFQPMYTTKGFKLGRGFGMSSAHATIRDHGGIIQVKDTKPGVGTTIEILFPIGTIQPSDSLEVPPESYSLFARVLWVDDEKPIRDLGKRLLERLGHFAETAVSGADALASLECSSYDLLITDLGMPHMSGWQLADLVRVKYPMLKIAVCTGWGADVSAAEKARHGVGYVLGKPTTLDEIRQLIQDVLQLHG